MWSCSYALPHARYFVTSTHRCYAMQVRMYIEKWYITFRYHHLAVYCLHTCFSPNSRDRTDLLLARSQLFLLLSLSHMNVLPTLQIAEYLSDRHPNVLQ